MTRHTTGIIAASAFLILGSVNVAQAQFVVPLVRGALRVAVEAVGSAVVGAAINAYRNAPAYGKTTPNSYQQTYPSQSKDKPQTYYKPESNYNTLDDEQHYESKPEQVQNQPQEDNYVPEVNYQALGEQHYEYQTEQECSIHYERRLVSHNFHHREIVGQYFDGYSMQTTFRDVYCDQWQDVPIEDC